MASSEDTTYYFAAFGVPVRVGTSRTTGVVDFERVTEPGAEGYAVEIDRHVCRYAAGALPTLAALTVVTIGDGPFAGTYRLLHQGPDAGDGAMHRLVLKAAA